MIIKPLVVKSPSTYTFPKNKAEPEREFSEPVTINAVDDIEDEITAVPVYGKGSGFRVLLASDADPLKAAKDELIALSVIVSEPLKVSLAVDADELKAVS